MATAEDVTPSILAVDEDSVLMKDLQPVYKSTNSPTKETEKGQADDALYPTYTVSEALEAIGMGLPQTFICIATAIAAIAVYSQVILVTTISDVMKCEFRLSQEETALISTMFFIGEIFGSYPSGRVIDLFGRRAILLLLTVCLFYFGALTALIPSLYWMLVLRFLTGFCAVGMLNVFSVLVGEMTPPKIRMASLLLLPLFFGVGTVYIAGMGLLIVPSLGWRWQAAAAAFPPLFILSLSLNFPESARYLIHIGEMKQALQLLKNLAKKNDKLLPKGDLVQMKGTNIERQGTILSLLKGGLLSHTLSLWVMWFTSYFVYIGVALSTNNLLNLEVVVIPFDANVTTEVKLNPNPVIYEPKNTASLIPPYYDECGLQDCTNFFDGPGGVKFLVASIGDMAAIPVVFAIFLVLGQRWTAGVCMALSSITLACISGLMRLGDMTALIFAVRVLSFGVYGLLFLITIEAYPTYNRSNAMATCQFMAKLSAVGAPFISEILFIWSPETAMVIFFLAATIGALSAFFFPASTDDHL